jgi:hypothetical protein
MISYVFSSTATHSQRKVDSILEDEVPNVGIGPPDLAMAEYNPAIREAFSLF